MQFLQGTPDCRRRKADCQPILPQPSAAISPAFPTDLPPPFTFPVSTVTDAFGSNTLCPSFHSPVVRRAGPSGSAWLFGPAGCHTYSAAPNVTIFTGPTNRACVSFPASSNAIFTSCGLFGSLLIISSDQTPSGRFTPYAVIRSCFASSCKSPAAGYNRCTPLPCFTQSRFSNWLAKYWAVYCLISSFSSATKFPYVLHAWHPRRSGSGWIGEW